MSSVSILSTPRYDSALLDDAVARHFSLLGLEAMARPGLRVVLKPNLLMKRAPDTATTTHPEVVAAVARWFRARGVSDITLADSPGGPYTKALLSAVYAGCGMAEVAEREGISLNYDTTYEERHSGGKRAASFSIIKPVAQAELLVNLCKLKTHCMTGLSGGVKNLFGCVPGLQKPELHYRFQEPEAFCDMLCDLYETLRPAVTLVDAVDAMEGDGPSGGTPVHAGLTLCSADAYALDVVLCRLIGMEQERAGTVKASVARGLTPRFEDIMLLGEPQLLAAAQPFIQPRSKAVDFNRHLPRWLQRAAGAFTNRFAVARPVVEHAKCIGCGKCAETCPAHTIDLQGGKATIRQQACIRCYCCHELCPVRAIRVSRNRLFRL